MNIKDMKVNISLDTKEFDRRIKKIRRKVFITNLIIYLSFIFSIIFCIVVSGLILNYADKVF